MATTEERKKALERKFTDGRPPLAYAKLSGRLGDDSPFKMLITHLPVDIGRGAVTTTPGPQIMLGEQKAISRKHARIQWNQSKSGFELECLGKNGINAAGTYVTTGVTIALPSKTPIKIGPARVYFLAAVRSTCSTMSGFKLMQKAFEKAKAKTADGLGVDEIVAQILDMFPKSEAELGGKDNLKSFVSNYIIEDTQTFEPVAASNPVRYKMKPTVATTDDAESARKRQKTE